MRARAAMVPAVRQRVATLQTSARREALFRARRPVTPVRRTLSFVGTAAVVLGGACFAVYSLDSRAGVHRWVVAPLLRATLDPESAAEVAIDVLRTGLGPRDCGTDDERLRIELFGKTLSNPIGLAAGFDKQAEAIDGLFDLGFGLVEVGSITPEPQAGNPRPRMFRLAQDEALINRMGFNSDGHEVVRERLHRRVLDYVVRVLAAGQALVPDVGAVQVPDSSRLGAAQLFAGYPEGDPALLDAAHVPRSLKQDRLLSVNLGKNKESREDSALDYVRGVETLGPYADMVVVNVSSPNTPGLRRMQRRSVLQGVLADVVRARDALKRAESLPVLVKVAPDLSEAELQDIAIAVQRANVDGIVVSNTTTARPYGLLSRDHVHERGGLSGRPLKPYALAALETLYVHTEGRVPLIGCGGIASGKDALEFAKAGASAVQLYTALGYQGVGLPRRIKDELAELLAKENKSWAQVVGTGVTRTQRYAPDAVEKLDLHPASQDAFDRSVVSVKNELQYLRDTFSSGEEMPSQRRAVPFHIDPHDSEYIALLDRVHRVLDTRPTFSEDGLHYNVPVPQRASAVPEQVLTTAAEQRSTQGQVIHGAVRDARRDVPASLDAVPHTSNAQVNAAANRTNKPEQETISGLAAPPASALVEKVQNPATTFKEVDRQRVV